METELLTIITLCVFAVIGGMIAKRFKQPTVLGLLVIGALIGPNTLNLVSNQQWIDMIIEFGAILLLFVVGLEFDLTKLVKVGFKGITVAVLKVGIAFFIGFQVAALLGYSTLIGIFAGAIISFSSTVVIIKVLEQKSLYNRQEIPLLLTVLIIEDILAIIALIFFSGLQQTNGTSMVGMVEHLIIGLSTLLIAYGIMLCTSKIMFNWLLKNGSDDMTRFLALGFCAGFSVLAYVLGLSPSAGAFLAGSIVASLPNVRNLEKAIAPYNLIISSLFFIAVGTLVNFASVKVNIMLILVLVLTVILTRLFAFGLIVYLFANFKGDKMFFSSMAMFSVGEFALLIAQQSKNFNVGIDLMSISAAIIFITAVLMSLTLNYSDRLYQPTSESVPYGWRKRMERYAGYIKSLSEELDLDNKYSQSLKKNFFSTMIGLLVVLLTIFGWRKLSSILSINEVSQTIVTASYLATIALIIATMFYVILKSRKVLKSLSEIFANATNNKSATHSRHLVIRAFAAFILLAVALIFPFIMFMFGLSTIYVLIPFGLLSLFGWQIHKLSEGASDTTSSFQSVAHWHKENHNKLGWRA